MGEKTTWYHIDNHVNKIRQHAYYVLPYTVFGGTWRNMFVPDYHVFELNRSASGLNFVIWHGFSVSKSCKNDAKIGVDIKKNKQSNIVHLKLLHLNQNGSQRWKVCHHSIF